MSKNSSRSWFRGVKAITAGFFRKHRQMGAEVPAPTFLFCVGFVLVLFVAIVSLAFWRFPYHLFGDEVYNIVVVNAPQSFIDFNNENRKYFDIMADEYGPSKDLKNNFDNIVNFEYTYHGNGSTEFIYKENSALYDFVTFGKWMRENKAYLTVVFPEDFDGMIGSRVNDNTSEKPDILTYYRTNSLEYPTMKTEFIGEYLHLYQDYLREKNGWTYGIFVDSEIREEPNYYSGQRERRNPLLDGLGRSFVPLLLFIIILYASMSAGTNVIAGQKERGTFTGILLTPVPRNAIVAGNLAGVTLKTLIPVAITAAPLFLIPYYRSWSGFAAIVIQLIVLTVFVASVTLLISVINDTVVSAQTAFLPVFIILVSVCVTCIQDSTEHEAFYLYLPVYGQFYGIGDALTGSFDAAGILVSSLATLLFAVLIAFITERLLHSERFTVSVERVTDKEIRNARSGKLSFVEISDKISDNIMFFIKEVLYPLAVIGIFQLVAIVPSVIAYMRRAEYSQFISDLRNVSAVDQTISKTFEVLTIFMGDPAFLALMALAYCLMIIACVLRTKRVFKKKTFADALDSCGLPVNKPGRIAREYLTGLLFGFLMMSCVVLILKLSGQIEITGFGLERSVLPVFFINLLMWFPQGASEELLFRGYMIPRIEGRFKKAFAVFFSSLLFSVFHSLNMGYTPLASVNLFLIAILFALIYIKTGSIWMTSAMHTFWNLSQGNIYGLQVSGNEAKAALVKTAYLPDAKSVVTGGAFGPEGGLAVTLVTTICIVIVIISLAKSRDLPRDKDA